MEEIVNQVAQKTGLSQDQARLAVQTVVDTLKTKLPEPIASQIDGFLSSPSSGDMAGQAMGALGGLFGGKS